MVYRSKISWILASFLAAVFGGCFIMAIIDGIWEALIILIPVILFLVHMFSNTYYTIQDEKLIVKCGFYKQQFDIKSFRKIEETDNAMSAPALSPDRLELYFKGYDSVVLSPKNKAGFIAHIQQINPAIEYEPRNKK